MKFRSIGLAAALLVALAGLASAQTKDHVFKVGAGLSEDHPQVKSLMYFAEQLAAQSGGKVVAQVHASGSLGNDLTMTSALRGGTLEMALKYRRIAERTPRHKH